MPRVLEQIDGLSIAEKREVLTYLIRHVTFEVRPGAVTQSDGKRIGLMEGKWHLPDDATDRKMDEEIEQLFAEEMDPA